ncbi:MAG: hypothetical protein Tsb0020_29340 [Haliangiales bacterium]
MSQDSNLDHVCDFYDNRPDLSGAAISHELQTVLDECVFIEDGHLVGLATAARHMGSMAALESACRRCGQCCHGLQHARDPLPQPETDKCAHLLCQIGLAPHLRKPAATQLFASRDPNALD